MSKLRQLATWIQPQEWCSVHISTPIFWTHFWSFHKCDPHGTKREWWATWERSFLHFPDQYLLDSNLSEWYYLIISLFLLVNTIQKNSPGNTEFLSSNFEVAQGKQQPIIIPTDYKWLLSEELCSILFSFVAIQDGLWWPKIKIPGERQISIVWFQVIPKCLRLDMSFLSTLV